MANRFSVPPDLRLAVESLTTGYAPVRVAAALAERLRQLGAEEPERLYSSTYERIAEAIDILLALVPVI